MAIVSFRQDPQYPPGTGDFVLDDGRTIYAHDPEEASRFLAQNDAGAPGGAPESRADVGPNYSPAPPPQQLSSEPNYSPAPPAGSAPAAPPPGQQPGEQPPTGPMMNPEDAQRAAMNAYVFRPPAGGAKPAGFVPKAKSETIETTAAPVSDAYVKEWAEAEKDKAAAQRQVYQTDYLRSQNEALHLYSQLPALQQKASEAKAKQAEIQRGLESDRAELRSMLQEASSKKVDPNRWFKEKGTLVDIGIIMGQAFGAYAATIGHGENWAQRIVNDSIARDVQAQRDDIEQGNTNANNALKQLQLKYGDLDQATAALTAIQQQVAANQMGQYAAIAKSQEAANAYGVWSADHRQDMLKTLKSFDDLAHGKVTAKVDSAYRQATGGQLSEAQIRDRIATVKALQESGLTATDLTQGGRKIDVERERAAKAGAGKEDKAADTINQLDDQIRSLNRLKSLYGKSGPLSPAERGEMDALQRTLPLEIPKVLTGSTRPPNAEELEELKGVVGHAGATYRGDMFGAQRASLEALEGKLIARRKFLQSHPGAAAGGEEDLSGNTPAGFSHPIEEVQ